MDLLCTENIMNDNYETEAIQCQQKQQQQHQSQQQLSVVTNPRSTTSPYSNSNSCSSSSLLSSSSCCSSSSSSSSSSYSSGYNSNASNSCSSSSSNSSSATSCAPTCVSTCCRHRRQTASESSNHAAAAVATATAAAEQLTPTLATTTQTQRYQQLQPHQHNAYTNNLINRTLDFVNTATEDPTFLTDRCLENALKAEEKRPHLVCAYFKTVQKDITPPMRKIVAEWMMEVCAEEKCQEEVVLLALNYMDRFLSTKSVRKTHLQILAAACLLLASKLREPSCRALSAELLVFYTDNSIFKGDLIKWELYVLSRLGWDLSSVTPLDFLELLLIRLPIRSAKCPDLNVDKVRQHAQAFISLAAKEHYFSMYSASTIAASSIAAALSGLNWHLRTGQNLRHLLNLLTDLTSVEQDYLHACMMKMETIFEEHSRNLQPYMETQQQQASQQASSQTHRHHSNHNHGMSGNASALAMLPDLTQTCKMQAHAQKDVQDIKF